MVAAVRLHELEEAFDGLVRLNWKSFLLRPEVASKPRSFENFREYTKSWQRPAAEEPRAGFKEWASDEGPPSHSVPPHVVAKAAAALGDDAFSSVHQALLQAYFHDSRNIADERVLQEIWDQLGLQASGFPNLEDSALQSQVLSEHVEAMENGASGAPAVRLDGFYGVLMGAQPTAVYARWMQRVIDSASDE